MYRYLITAALLSLPSFAGSFSYTAVTTGQPVWNRPALYIGLTPTVTSDWIPVSTGIGLSTNGTAVPYAAKTLYITGNGSYTFSSTGTAPANWDNALFLYQNSFNPTNPLNHILIGQTGYAQTNQGTSSFTTNLTSGTYILLVTGVFNNDFGTASMSATGPGTISATPEPGQILLIATGLLAIGAKRV